METYKKYNLFKNEINNNFNTDNLEILFIENFFNEEESVYFMESLISIISR